MKKLTILLNGLSCFLSLMSVYLGAKTSLLFLLLYGLSLGAVFTQQKNYYYWITLVLNTLTLLLGLAFVVNGYVTQIESMTLLVIVLIMLVLTPLVNLVFILSKMAVIKKRTP